MKLASTEGFNELKLVPKRILKSNNPEKNKEKIDAPIEQKLVNKEIVKEKIEEAKIEVKMNNFVNKAINNLDMILSETEINLNDIFCEDILPPENNAEENRRVLDHIQKVFVKSI